MKKLSISEQCRRAGIDRRTYYQRLKTGKTDLFAPPKVRKRPISEETRNLLKENGILLRTYWRRLELGWTEFEASNIRPYAEVYKINGKSVHSLLSDTKYQAFLKLIYEKEMLVEEAFERVTQNKLQNQHKQSRRDFDKAMEVAWKDIDTRRKK